MLIERVIRAPITLVMWM